MEMSRRDGEGGIPLRYNKVGRLFGGTGSCPVLGGLSSTEYGSTQEAWWHVLDASRSRTLQRVPARSGGPAIEGGPPHFVSSTDWIVRRLGHFGSSYRPDHKGALKETRSTTASRPRSPCPSPLVKSVAHSCCNAHRGRHDVGSKRTVPGR